MIGTQKGKLNSYQTMENLFLHSSFHQYMSMLKSQPIKICRLMP